MAFPPNETDADAGALESASADLMSLSGSVGVSADDLAGSVATGEAAFSDVIASSISAKGAAAVAACQDVVGRAAHASGVVSEMAAAVETYDNKIATLQNRWAPWADGGAPTGALLNRTEEQIDEQREAIRGQVKAEADKAYQELEDAAEDQGASLSEGPSAADVQRMVDSGAMSWWLAYELYGIEVAGQPPRDFMEEQGQRAAEITAGMNEDGALNEEDLRKLNRLMLLAQFDNGNYFSTSMMEELGPEGVVQVTALLTLSDGNWDLRRDANERLGLVLAQATDSNNADGNGGGWVGNAWIDELMVQGAKPVDMTVDGQDLALDPDGRIGYTFLTNLFSYPQVQYPPSLMTPVAEHISFLTDQGFARGDEMNNVLRGLENNPVAAVDLLSNTSEFSRDEYLNQFGDDMSDGKQRDMLEWLLNHENRRSTVDVDRAGNVIETAATGQSTNPFVSDDADIPRNRQMAAITDRLIDYVSKNPEDFEGPGSPSGAMADNFANVTNAWMDEFYYKYLSEEYQDADWLPGRSDLGTLGSDKSKMDQWLQVIGHDKEATLTVSGGAMAYTNYMFGEAAGAGIERHINGESLPDDASTAAMAIKPFGRIMGQLTTGQYETITDEKVAEADRANWLINQGASAVTTTYGLTPVGKVDIPYLSPNAKAANWVVSTITNSIKVDPSGEIETEHNAVRDQVQGELDEFADDAMGAVFHQYDPDRRLDADERQRWRDAVDEAVGSGHAEEEDDHQEDED